jgi:ligand-binding SRPBCC domain-containing protein
LGIGDSSGVSVIHHLARAQFIPRPLPEVFAFFQRPENLANITPPWLKFIVLSSSPVPMAQGIQIDYAIRLFGIRLRWTSRITEYDPPHLFVDEQIKGPYALWRHRHTFTPQDHGVMVRDEVAYALPFGVLGLLAQWLYVRWSLQAIFNYREKMVRELLG